MSLTDAEERMIRSVIINFKWGRVRKAMKALNWGWFTSQTPGETPSIGELVLSGQELLRQVVERGLDNSIGSGGFYAQYDQWGQLSLKFVLESWEENSEDYT